MNTYLAKIIIDDNLIEAGILASTYTDAISAIDEAEKQFGHKYEIVEIKLIAKYAYWDEKILRVKYK